MADRPRNREPRLDEAMLSDDDEAVPGVDPELVSRLETWFGPMADEEPAAEEGGFDPGWAVQANPHQEWRRARALETAERGDLWRRLEHRGQAYARMVEPLPPIDPLVEREIVGLDLAAWPIRPANGPDERLRPEDLPDALRQQTPQSVLRDLYRPVPEVGPIKMERIDLVGEVGTQPLELVRTVIDTRYRIDIQALLDTPGEIRGSMAEMRHRIDEESWAEARPENPAPFPSTVSTADLSKWFGS